MIDMIGGSSLQKTFSTRVSLFVYTRVHIGRFTNLKILLYMYFTVLAL